MIKLKDCKVKNDDGKYENIYRRNYETGEYDIHFRCEKMDPYLYYIGIKHKNDLNYTNSHVYFHNIYEAIDFAEQQLQNTIERNECRADTVKTIHEGK